jgi:hypothetical protein
MAKRKKKSRARKTKAGKVTPTSAKSRLLGYDLPPVPITALADVLRKHDIDISAPDIIQMMMESDETYSVNEGDEIRVYQKDTDDLLMWMPAEGNGQHSETEEGMIGIVATDDSKTVFLHYGQHTLEANVSPNGQLAFSIKDILIVLCRINGATTDVIDRMPESDNPNDYGWAINAIYHKVKDRPETKAFFCWLHNEYARFEKMRN